jgi:hypothetical protein
LRTGDRRGEVGAQEHDGVAISSGVT